MPGRIAGVSAQTTNYGLVPPAQATDNTASMQAVAGAVNTTGPQRRKSFYSNIQ